jgi:hypothetical protein
MDGALRIVLSRSEIFLKVLLEGFEQLFYEFFFFLNEIGFPFSSKI